MAVKTYSLKKDGNTKLSANFSVREFKCHDGSDKILIAEELVASLQKLRDQLHALVGKECGGIVIVSGYRTSAHDKASGGSGSGPHTKGWAADFYAVDKAGKKIPGIYVQCAAQLLGIKGIERIEGGYNTHIDPVRSDKWWAYQVKSNGAFTYPTLSDWFVTIWAIAEGVTRPPAAKNPHTYPIVMLSKSTKGHADMVKWVQWALNAKNAAQLVVDGIWGAKTTAAVKAFQKAKGLAADGIVGEKTRGKLV